MFNIIDSFFVASLFALIVRYNFFRHQQQTNNNNKQIYEEKENFGGANNQQYSMEHIKNHADNVQNASKFAYCSNAFFTQ